MPGTFSPAANFRGNYYIAIPACITARAWRTCRDACRDRLPAVTGKTFPAFPAHAQPQFCVSGKRPIVLNSTCYIHCRKDPKSASTRRLPVDTEGDWYDGRTSVDYSCTRMRSNGSINAKKEGIPENHVTHVNEQNHEKQNHSNHCNNVKNNNTLPPEMTANTSRTGVRNPVYVSSMPSVGPGDESTTGSKTAATAQSKNNLPETETTYMWKYLHNW